MTEKIDEKDQHILEVLQDHADYTVRQVAKRLQLPITTVHHRIKKLKQEKIIRKFTVEVDPEAVGKNFRAYVLISANLAVLKQKKKTQYDLARELRKFHFVEMVDIVSGGTDLVAIITVRDVAEFDRVLLEKIQGLEGIEKTQSMIVIHSGK